MRYLSVRPHRWIAAAITAGCMLSMGGGLSIAQDVPKAPKWNPPPFKESFANRQEYNIWKRLLRKTDPLLRPPFAESPLDTVKGLAAQIRSEELDVKNRVAAVEYLGKVDCVAYPEAQEMLIDVLHNDKWEEVRYAAALALKNMLSGCREEDEKQLLKTGKKGRYDTCRGCCNEAVLNALAKTAYEYDDRGCCFEPSQRVREAAVDAINACCVPCNYGPYMVPSKPPEVGPVDDKGEEKPPTGGEQRPTPSEQAPPAPPTEAALPPLPLSAQGTTQSRPLTHVAVSIDPQAAAFPEMKGLNGYCVVALKARMFVKARPEFYSVYKGYRYHFWSNDAKAEFDRFPESYAIQFDGADPVELAAGQFVTGQFLREFEDRFYLFASRENWDAFKTRPAAYLPQKDTTPASEIVRVGALGRKAQSSLAPAFASHPESLR